MNDAGKSVKEASVEHWSKAAASIEVNVEGNGLIQTSHFRLKQAF